VSGKRGRPLDPDPKEGALKTRKSRAIAARKLYQQRKEWLRQLRRDPQSFLSLLLAQEPVVAFDRNGPSQQTHRYVPGVETVTPLGDDSSFVIEDGWRARKTLVRCLEGAKRGKAKRGKAKRTKTK
jgi:hypothetical protein